MEAHTDNTASSLICPRKPTEECKALDMEIKPVCKRSSQCEIMEIKRFKKNENESDDRATKPVLTAQDVSIMVSQDEATLRKLIHDEILNLTEARGPDKTICPSEVARKLFPNGWRSVMPLVRDVGAHLAQNGRITIMQKGQPVKPENLRGPIRFRFVQ